MSLVFDTVRPTGIVAASDLADPVGRVASDAGNGFGGEATREEPEEVPVTALHRILVRPVTSSEFNGDQVGFEIN